MESLIVYMGLLWINDFRIKIYKTKPFFQLLLTETA